MSEYVRNLPCKVKLRYLDKVVCIDSLDPYTITSEMFLNGQSVLPVVGPFDIMTYLVITHSAYTSQQIKAYKSLEAYQYYKAGFVHNVKHVQINDYFVILAKMTIVQLKSRDGVAFDVELAIIERSEVIRTLIKSLGEDVLDEPIPLPNTKSDFLRKIIEFATHHKDDPIIKNVNEDVQMTEWDREFLQVDAGILAKLLKSAYLLGVDDLTHLICKKIADIIKELSVEELKVFWKNFHQNELYTIQVYARMAPRRFSTMILSSFNN